MFFFSLICIFAAEIKHFTTMAEDKIKKTEEQLNEEQLDGVNGGHTNNDLLVTN